MPAHITTLTTVAPRLRKLILMLSSDHDAEVVGAARAIGRVLADSGTDWHALADVIAPPIAPGPGEWRRHLRFAADHIRRLSTREADFIATLAQYRTEPSAKQLRWLANICARLAREGA